MKRIDEDFEDITDEWEEEVAEQSRRRKKRRLHKKSKIILISVLSFLALLTAGGVLALTKMNGMLNKVNYVEDHTIKQTETDMTEEELREQQIQMEANSSALKDQDIYNVLLIGEEAIGSGESRGRSDSMIVVSLNKKLGTVKMVSFLRDCFVQIPGYKNNKLNASFAFGDGPLVIKTISNSFDIYIDGYVKVNFKGFEKIINKLGGVEIELTEAEAHYLNTTNYISKKKYRNVKAGKQVLNGNQALGYSRVRKQPTIDGEHDDYGRTARQRRVLKAVFNKYKAKGLFELLDLADEILPLTTTNMKKEDLVCIVKDAVSLNLTDISTLRIPINNGFRYIEHSPTTSVTDFLELDFTKNKKAINDFLFKKTEETPAPTKATK